MTFTDYNELIIKNTTETDTICPGCKQNAKFKYTKLEDVQPEIVLVVFECTHCNIKDTSFFNEKINTRKLVIECHFNDKEDFKREINLNMHSQLFIEYRGIKYEHESSLPLVISVEGIIDQAIEALDNENNSIIGDKQEMKKTVEIFKLIKEDYVFYMKIIDNDGSSRVGRIGKGVYEMQNCDIKEFNDEKVHHYLVIS